MSTAAISASSPGERTSTNVASPAQYDDDYGRRWERINSKVNARDWHDADTELRNLLARYPDDTRGRALLAEVRRAISASHQSRRSDRDRDRRVDEDHDDDRDEDVDEHDDDD